MFIFSICLTLRALLAALRRLLEESWRAVKPALQELLRTLPKRLPAVAPEVSALQGLVKRLDDSLEGCAAAGEVWQLYRRILGFYSHHEKFQPVAPPAPAVGTGLSALLLSGAGGSSAQPSPASDGCAPAGSETVTSVTRLEDGVATNIDCEAAAGGSLFSPSGISPSSAACLTGADSSDELSSAATSRSGSGVVASGSSVEARPVSPATRLQGAAALLARPGSPLQPAMNRGASGNLSGSSTNRSCTSPQMS